ncbi:MAG: response regulator [Bacteroidetes bacterium]|nr:response regulator [Bacteroidota bacterium]
MEHVLEKSNNNLKLILIAEDSLTQAEKLKYTLEKHNYKIILAKDGKEAFEKVIKHKPSLVISDIVMPEMNGYELCHKIKSDETTFDIPVIILTSLSNSEDILEGISCGADNFITKPYNENYLISHIEQILTNSDLSINERVRVGVEIYFSGKRRFITANQQQMLTLLISTYEAAVQKNNELTQTQDELKTINEHLEEIVIERTKELSEEITIRKQTEERVVKLNRIYSLLSNINKIIVWVRNTDQLLKDVCNIVVDKGKFQHAWIGIINNKTNTIEKSASAGLSNNLINIDTYKNPAFLVIETKKHFISNDINGDKSIPENWKQESLSLGFKSFAVLPISVRGEVLGSFCIYSNEINFFDEIEISLLNEMATDISFAIEYIYKESERKQVEKDLHLSELKYRNQANFLDSIIEKSPFSMWISDAKGILIRANQALRNILNLTDDMIINKYNVLHDKNIIKQGFLPVVEDIFNNLKPARFILFWTGLKAGDVDLSIANDHWLDVSMFPITNEDGELVNVVCQYVNITEQKRAENEIKKLNISLDQRVKDRTEQLEDTNKELEAFCYSVSHDLKAPLRAVISFSKILNDDFAPQLNSEVKRYLNHILTNAENMGMHINDLLNFSRMSRTELQKSQVDLHILVQKIENELIAEFKNRKLTINIMDMPLINADEKLMYHVMLNLISNAIKFTSKVKNAIVEIGCTSQNKKNIFYIKDNGIGFDMKYADKIFDIFHRLHSVNEFPGTGIGLSIVQRIIHKHEGKIWVKSEINKGTTFFFII